MRCNIAPVSLVGLLLLGLVATRSAPQAGEKSKRDPALDKEVESLQGVWTFFSRAQEGKIVGEEDTDFLFIVHGNKATLKKGEKVGQVCLIRIVDATGIPKKMDLLMIEGINKGELLRAIYEIDGDKFRYCGSLASRPKTFATKEGDKDTYCMVYKRKKASAK